VLKDLYISNILKELAASMFRRVERERMVHYIEQEGVGLRLCRNPWGTSSPGKVLDHFLNLQMWAAGFH